MNVCKWITSKDYVAVNFNKYIDGDYIEILEIQMNISSEYSVITNDDHTLTHFPISVTRTFYGDQIPFSDTAMVSILDQMYQNLVELQAKYESD